MSNTIHPSWHTTDDEDIVPVREVKKNETSTTPSEVTNVSRRPAAIVGILVVVGLSTLFYQGLQNLTGQLTEFVQIQITETGFEPEDISVVPGEQISWINERSVPQYIISETLCDTSGECLNTATMFQDDTATYTVPEETADGTYTYFSPTDPTQIGTITVGNNGQGENIELPEFLDAADEPPPQDAAQVDTNEETTDPFTLAQQSLLESIQRQLALDEELEHQQVTTITDEPEVPETVVSQSGIPSNPYTVGGERQFPFDSDGNPIPSAFENNDRAPIAASVNDNQLPTFGRDAQKPFRQAETGPGIWAVLLLSIFGLWQLQKKVSPVYKTR